MEMNNVKKFFVALFVSAVLMSSATSATMESPAPAPGTSSATVAFPVVVSIVAASLSAFSLLHHSPPFQVTHFDV
ncbi:unnamed protein product [Brassica oleracea var. botrytis]